MARVWRVCLAVACLVPAISAAAYGSGFITWDTELAVPLSASMLEMEGSSTSFSGGYNWEEGYGISGTVFIPLSGLGETVSVSAHLEDDVVVNWPVGTWSVNANASFSLQTPSLLGLSSTANVTAYGISTTATFNLYPFRGAYSTGLTLTLAGATQLGWGISATGTFGDPWNSPCNLDFTGLIIGFEAFPWGCVHTDVEFVFTTAGYEKTTIDIDVDLWDGVLVLDGALEFAVQTKTLSLTPYLNVGEQCIWLSVGIEPQEIGPGTASSIDQLIIQGLGITDCEIGPVTFSTISALGGGLYRNAKASDIDLHANNYYVALAPDANPGAWFQTDYITVITIRHAAATFTEGFASTQLTLDFYFGTTVTTLFDFALLTAEWQHAMSEAFSYRIAVQFDPTGADHCFEFGFTVSTTLQ